MERSRTNRHVSQNRGELRRLLQSRRHPVPKYRIIKITRMVIEIASEPVEAACRQSRIARSRGSAGARPIRGVSSPHAEQAAFALYRAELAQRTPARAARSATMSANIELCIVVASARSSNRKISSPLLRCKT